MLLFIHMELLYKYIEELDADTSINEFNIRDVQMKLPAIKHKWAGRLIRSKIELAGLEKKKNIIIDDAVRQLIEKSPVKLSVPLARNRVIDLDSVKTINDEINNLELIIEFLGKMERILNSMTFDIKNLTEIMKLELQ